MSSDGAPRIYTSPAFFVGVSGYLHLDPEQRKGLRDKLKTLFRFLREGGDDQRTEIVKDLIEGIGDDAITEPLRDVYDSALSQWTGLGAHTPIVLLTNLAPGVDTLAARLLLDDEEFKDQQYFVRVPCPFPPDIYLGASTFVRGDADDALRQREFLDTLGKIVPNCAGLSELANGTSDVPEEIQRVLTEIPADIVYPAYLREDVPHTVEERRKRWLNDRGNEERQNLRYYAAGEFLTVTSHLMIVVFDGREDGKECGTAKVVHARLNGPDQGTLDTTSDLIVPHGGPTWHLRATRADDDSNADQPGQVPPLRILHPTGKEHTPQGEIIASDQQADAALQSDRLKMFARIGNNLKQFGTNRISRHAGYDRPENKNSGKHEAIIEVFPEPFRSNLRQIWIESSLASTLSMKLQGIVKRTLFFLCLLTFIAVAFLHLCTHWHPPEIVHAPPAAAAETQSKLYSSDVVSDNAVEAVSAKADQNLATAKLAESHGDGNKDHVDDEHGTDHESADHAKVAPFKYYTGLGALLFAFFAIGYFALHHVWQLESQGYDARAIAEGLRVQFFWNIAGLGKSVSANYMSRHRGELAWIRAVIRSAAFPYQRWADCFDGLEASKQVTALKHVQTEWLQDQIRYFTKASHREERSLHLLHQFGGVAALAGLITFLRMFCYLNEGVVDRLAESVCHPWVGVWPLVVAIVIAVVMETTRQKKAIHKKEKRWFHHLRASHAGRDASWSAWIRERLANLFSVAAALLAPSSQESARAYTSRWDRFKIGCLNFAGMLPIALLVTCLVWHVCHYLEDNLENPPHIDSLANIAGGILLVIGALMIAWTEKSLKSEYAYQYETMATLFRAADAQMSAELAAMERADEQAIRKGIERIQKMLFNTGRQALDENAEWLLLHRARPLEPVMAG